MHILQINVQDFRHFNALYTLIEESLPDIITMQEVREGIFGTYTTPADCLDQLTTLGYYIAYSPTI